jgi:cell division protein FtsB
MAGFYQKLLIRLPGRKADVIEAELAAEDLEDENEALRAQVAELKERASRDRLQRENEALRARIAELEAQAVRR